MGALLAFTFIVTTRQYIGSPIMCVHTRDIPKDVLNTHCWIHPTYTLSSAHWKRVGIDVPHPGVDKTRDERDKKHVKYYQWVGFCLFFQVRHIGGPRWTLLPINALHVGLDSFPTVSPTLFTCRSILTQLEVGHVPRSVSQPGKLNSGKEREGGRMWLRAGSPVLGGDCVHMSGE